VTVPGPRPGGDAETAGAAASDGAAGAGDDLDPTAVSARLTTAWLGRQHEHTPSCASTNDRAAARGRAGAPQGLLVTTDAQTDGRGRLGRIWHAAPHENLTFSILLRPPRPAAEIPPLTLLVGGAVAAALRAMGFEARVKWPNDVLLRAGGGPPRKVAGILTEAVSLGDRIGHVVVGVGINVNATAFPDELVNKASSLRLARGAKLGRADVLARVLAAFEPAYDRYAAVGPEAAVTLWNAHADRDLRCRARVGDRDVEGRPEGVQPDGTLRLRDDDGVVHRVVAGEIVTLD
jgi:BirA family biotin operon repressor/biotin-[acetyl-CoA-carboxylase] ligase